MGYLRDVETASKKDWIEFVVTYILDKPDKNALDKASGLKFIFQEGRRGDSGDDDDADDDTFAASTSPMPANKIVDLVKKIKAVPNVFHVDVMDADGVKYFSVSRKKWV